MIDAIDKFDGEYRFLSNFYHSTQYVIIDGNPVITRSVEHAYQASKTLNPEAQRDIIRPQVTPGQAKRMGQKVTLRDNWEAVKLAVMRDLVSQKFKININLGIQLLKTDNRLLVEGNTWGDRFWGICRGKGENWLGFILMGVRAELRGMLK